MEPTNQLSPIAAYLLAAAIGAALFVDVRRDLCRIVTGRNVVLLAIFSWFVLEPIMMPEFLKTYDQSTYNFGILYVFLAFTCFLIGYHGTRGCPVFPAFGSTIRIFDNEKMLWLLVVVGTVIGLTPIIIYSSENFVEAFQSMMGMRATWGGVLGRSRYGDARAAFLMIEMFVFAVSPFAAILLIDRKSTMFQRVFCALVILWTMLRAYGSGTRSSMIIAFSSAFVVLYWKASHRIRVIMIASVMAAAPLIYGLMAAIVASRGSGSFDWESGEHVNYVGNEMFRELLFIITNVPSERVNYQWGYVYYVQLVNPIPRFLWPDKPTLDTGLLMADLYDAVTSSGEAYLTISPGLIGEMYLNFGILGIIGLSTFGGWLVRGWDALQEQNPDSLPVLMYYSAGLGVLFIMGRSFTMSMFYGLLSFAFLAWVVGKTVNVKAE